MRGLIAAVLLLAAVAAGAGSVGAARAETPAPVGDAKPAVGGWSATPDPARDEESRNAVLRSMYITIGAMSGYMFTVMPVTTAAVTAAVAGGIASYWAYEYMLVPSARTDAPAQ